MMGEPVDEFSSLIDMRGGQGKLPVLPVVLIALGTLFLLNNLDLLRLRAVLRYWPVLLIAAGCWMLYERVKGGGESEKDAQAGAAEPPAGGAL